MMRALSAVELLNIWEESLAQTPARRALALLAAASPETTLNDLAELPIGQRDTRLMTLREWTFGARVVGMTNCPNCNERLELDFQLGDIRVSAEKQLTGELSLKQRGHTVRFRVPNSLDVLALENSKSDPLIGRQILLERCVTSATRRGKPVPVDQLPPEVTSAIAAQMNEADPQADVQLSLSCLACQHQWESGFDILTFFWNEIHAWALRALQEVHILASAYGWRENDILALSPWRRQIYLEMVGV
jgi:hypothetical protein